MKKFLKPLLTLESPFGHVWLGITAAVILFVLGFFDLGTMWELIFAALFLGLVLIVGAFVFSWLRKK